jgi:hypothetical protein
MNEERKVDGIFVSPTTVADNTMAKRKRQKKSPE